MKRFIRAAILLAAGATAARAQSMDDLNLQVHGYATQGFIYTTNDNWNTTNSSDGSAAWTEAVVNVSVQPQSKLRIGVQARYFLLGNYGDAISLDWAQADYKVNESFGVRAGKVKSPSGLLNETQDIDPAQLWVVLPQSVYPLASRDSLLSHYGGLVYGVAELGESLGKVEYRGFGGQRVISSDDGVLQVNRDNGLTVPNGITGRVYGGDLRWHTPLHGLMFGASDKSENNSGAVSGYGMQGTLHVLPFSSLFYYGRYETRKAMFAGEYTRLALQPTIQFPGIPLIDIPIDQRCFYFMATYKFTEKLSAGMYYSSLLDRKAAFNSNRYQKDWVLAARYDFNPYLYAKLEQHVTDGTAVGFSVLTNPGGLQPNLRMTLLKLGVSF